MKPVIEILLKPEDFVGNNFYSNCDCPLARAFTRHMQVSDCFVLTYRINSGEKSFSIIGTFGNEDYHTVKAEYALGSKRKWDHYVEIQEV